MLANKVALVGQLTNRVRNFKRKTDYSWQFSCDICGDSKKDPRKARFYIGRKDGDLMCHCHNCGWSGSVTSYLRLQHPDLSQQLVREKFIEQAPTLFDLDSIVEKESDEVLFYIFYLYKHNDLKQWAKHLSDKKVKLSKKSIVKLIDIHKNLRKENVNI